MNTDLAYFLLGPNGEQTGTFSLYQVKMMQKTGFIGPETRFWMEGMPEWLPVTRIEEFIDFRPPFASSDDPVQGPLTWSGSLARAIPSPYQKPPPPPKLASTPPRKTEVALKEANVEAPPTLKESSSAPGPETGITPAQPNSEPEPDVVPEQVRRPRSGHLLAYLSSALILLGLTLALLYAGSWVERKKSDPVSEVSFSGSNLFAVMDQVTIHLFQDDLTAWSVADDLKQQIYEEDDADLLQNLRVALSKETARHPGELRQQYIQDGRAEYIDAGRYRAIAYFDDSGTLIPPRRGEAWIAIAYKGEIVFAHREAPPLP